MRSTKSKSKQELENIKKELSCNVCNTINPGVQHKGLCKSCYRKKNILRIVLLGIVAVLNGIIITSFHIGGILIAIIFGIMVSVALIIPDKVYPSKKTTNIIVPEIEPIQTFTIIDKDNSEQEFFLKSTTRSYYEHANEIYNKTTEPQIKLLNKNNVIYVLFDGLIVGEIFDEEKNMFLDRDAYPVSTRLYKVSDSKIAVIVKIHFTTRGKAVRS